MRTIGDIRRLRLKELLDGGLRLADLNRKLERTVTDGTLSQILNGAKESKTGKPRQMGDKQARELEAAFAKPAGWFDRDPELDELTSELAQLRAHRTPAHALPAEPPQTNIAHAREPAPLWHRPPWPFQCVSEAEIAALSKDTLQRLDEHMAAMLAVLRATISQRESQIASDTKRLKAG